jgi:hypothetical protein
VKGVQTPGYARIQPELVGFGFYFWTCRRRRRRSRDVLDVHAVVASRSVGRSVGRHIDRRTDLTPSAYSTTEPLTHFLQSRERWNRPLHLVTSMHELLHRFSDRHSTRYSSCSVLVTTSTVDGKQDVEPRCRSKSLLVCMLSVCSGID